MTQNAFAIAISQPMFFPWVGLFEQIRLADVFVHYDDVQAPTGKGGINFITRVQIKSRNGITWLRIPISRSAGRYRPINETQICQTEKWRETHLNSLRNSYKKTPYFEIMYDLAKDIYSFPSDNLADFNCNCIERLAAWLGISTSFVRSSSLGIGGSRTRRVVDICSHFNARTYVTGLGALSYIDYSMFEQHDISLCYMKYEKKVYPQLYGEFTPYVSILDAIANCGPETSGLLCSKAVYWKEYISESR